MSAANLIIRATDKPKIKAILKDLRESGFAGDRGLCYAFLIRSIKTALGVGDEAADIILRGVLLQLDSTSPLLPTPGTTPGMASTPPQGHTNCGCSEERVPFNGDKERGNILNPPDLRILINDHSGHGSWITSRAQRAGAFDMAGNTYTFRCFDLVPGIRAHFLFTRHPSGTSPDVPDNPRNMGGGTKRAYYESRKPK